MNNFLHQIKITPLFLLFCIQVGAADGIDRQAVVTRHNIWVTSSSELQVGNSEFAITTDISGLISFSNNTILAHWGWHSDPLPSGQTVDDFKWQIIRGYDGRERPYPLYGSSQISEWFRKNPRKANLGRLGLLLIREDGSTAGMEDLQDPKQTLDLWKGLLTSQYAIDGQPVKVPGIGNHHFYKAGWAEPDISASSIHSRHIKAA